MNQDQLFQLEKDNLKTGLVSEITVEVPDH